jgi:hypothetical protein
MSAAERRGSRLLPWAIGACLAGAFAIDVVILRARSATSIQHDALVLLEHPGGDAWNGLHRLDATSLVSLALLWLPAIALLGWRARARLRGDAVRPLTIPFLVVLACAVLVSGADAIRREHAAQRMLCMSAAGGAYARVVREAAIARASKHAHGFLGSLIWSRDARARERCTEAARYLGVPAP